MNILIVGCGKIGTTLLSSLVAKGHDVTVIDNDQNVIVANTFNILPTCRITEVGG